MITVESLTRTYGDFTAVDDVSFTAQPGRVTGFLGPNGAGKSTTLRILVGLTPSTSGTATVGGRSYVDLPNPGLEVGVLLDASAQHAGRTGREILAIAGRFMGLPRRRVEEMLALVSLTPQEASRRVRDYSLGMRQRLGIATALIGEPKVLILDEPANGLDPAGIRWMRGLLRDYADRGGTVLLSSHLLHEIEVIADDLVVIGNGRIVAQGAKADLLRSAGSMLRTVDPVDRLRRRRTAARAAPGRWRRTRGDVPCAHSRYPTRHPQRQPPRRGTRMTTLNTATGPVAPTTAGCARIHRGIPLSRIISTELRKMFDTRSGFWLMASIGILALLATTAVIAFASTDGLTYTSFATAIGYPMTVVLPIIAVLSVTSEWSERSGLTTFTLVPHRSRIIAAKATVCVGVAVATIPLAFAVGALGNLIGATIAGIEPVWDLTVTNVLTVMLANILGLLVGFMLGVMIRSSAGALVGYFVYSFALPTLSVVLATSQVWFRQLQPWIDFKYAQGTLIDGTVTSQQWAHLGVTAVIWLVIPLVVGLRLVMRAEVK